MPKIRIESNPYAREINYYIFNTQTDKWDDIKNGNIDSKLRYEDNEKAFLPFRAKDIIDIISSEYGGAEKIEVEFKGTKDEYNELVSVCKAKDISDKISLSLASEYLTNASRIIDSTKEIFAEVEPIIEDVFAEDNDVSQKLEKVSEALNDRVPICVFGNYSAGKSTFINALIGAEILPSGGDPVTSKIFRIEDSKDDDFASVEYTHLGEKYLLYFEENDYRLEVGNKDDELAKEIFDAINSLENISLRTNICIALEKINDFEKRDRDNIVLGNDVKIKFPFTKEGVLGTSKNHFVIFDTPGSNSKSNEEHSNVLEKALKGFSNGIPVWVSTYDSLDSIDNSDLCEKILSIDALDKRFTMIVVNKADNADLEGNELSQRKENEILELDSVGRMYASGIYFVSSIMGLGAKKGELIESFYRKTFRKQKGMFADPEDEDYTTLYNYNIMPKQIKARVARYSLESENVVYANSGLYCVEKEIDRFASKYSSYNKCQMVSAFLNDVVEETNKRIDTEKDGCEKIRSRIRSELKEERKKLLDELQSVSTSYREASEKESKDVVKTFVKENLVYVSDAEKLKAKAKELYEIFLDQYIESERDNGFNLSELEVRQGAKDYLRSLFDSKEDFVDSIKGLFNSFDANKKEKEEQKAIYRSIDEKTSTELLKTVRESYSLNVDSAYESVSSYTNKYWENKSDSLKKSLVKIISGTEALSINQREELKNLVLNCKPLEFDDKSEKIFDKIKLLHGRIFGIAFSDSEKLNVKKLSSVYNTEIKKTINEMSKALNASCFNDFKNWMAELLDLIEKNITDYSPELRVLAKAIKDQTRKIAILEENKTKLGIALESIKGSMEWRTDE